MKNKLLIIAILTAFTSLFSCTNSTQQMDQHSPLPKISVKANPLVLGNIAESLTLNGKTVYLKKNTVFSPISGYISKINVSYGDEVQKNEILFEIQSKEAKALQNSGLNTDAAKVNYGIIKVAAPIGGVVNELITLGVGNFVAEGSPLCNIANNKDLLVQVNVPFQDHQMLKVGKDCRVMLPDNSMLNGTIFQIIPKVDELSQTQQVFVKLSATRELPENMNLSVVFITAVHKSVFILPKQSLLTDETQRRFWVMKIFDDSLAVEIPVAAGFRNDSLAEISSSGLSENDLIISEGGYGLPDSSFVKIIR